MRKKRKKKTGVKGRTYQKENFFGTGHNKYMHIYAQMVYFYSKISILLSKTTISAINKKVIALNKPRYQVITHCNIPL